MHRGALWAAVRGVAESDMTEVTEYAHVSQSPIPNPQSRIPNPQSPFYVVNILI